MIGVMVILLTFFSRLVTLVLVLWGVGVVLCHGYGI